MSHADRALLPFPTPPRARAAVALRRPPRVLFVDDDGALARRAIETLRADGLHVVRADSSSELAILASLVTERRPRFELIVSEVRLALVSGIELCELLADVGVAVPVIWTARACDDSIRASARRLHVRALLEKPYDLEELRTAVYHFVRPAAARLLVDPR